MAKKPKGEEATPARGRGRPHAEVPTDVGSSRMPVALITAVEALGDTHGLDFSGEVKRATHEHVVRMYAILSRDASEFFGTGAAAKVTAFLRAAEAYFKVIGIDPPKE